MIKPERVKAICEEEFNKILKELKKIDINFTTLPEDEKYRLGNPADYIYANSAIVKFGGSVCIYNDDLEKTTTEKLLRNLWKAKRQQLFLSLADLFSDLAEELGGNE